MKKNTNLVIYILVAMISLTLGILLCIESVADSIIKVVIAIGIAAYIAFFLVRKIVKRSSTMKMVVGVIEILVVSLMALGLFLAQFKVFNFVERLDLVQFLGVVIWIRGVCDLIIKTYSNLNKRDKALMLIINIVLITLGAWMVFKPIITDFTIRWIFVVFFFLVTVLSILMIVNFVSKKKAKN